MWLDLLIISIWGGIVSLDTTAAAQCLISHPLVSCTLLGLVLGNIPLAFSMGILMELVWLNELPIGAAHISEGNVGATTAAAIALIATEQTQRAIPVVALSLIIAILISFFGGRLVIIMRHLNGNIFEKLLYQKKLTQTSIIRAHMTGVLFSFLIGFFLTGITTFVCVYYLIPNLLVFLPAEYDKIFEPITSIFTGIGCAVLLTIFYQQNKHRWLILPSLIIGFLIFFL